jgi:hypothetical protein
MGTWGPGLWSDDTAADVRDTYRKALEDGLSDDDATGKVLAMVSTVFTLRMPGHWLRSTARHDNRRAGRGYQIRGLTRILACDFFTVETDGVPGQGCGFSGTWGLNR